MNKDNSGKVEFDKKDDIEALYQHLTLICDLVTCAGINCSKCWVEEKIEQVQELRGK